MAARQDQTLVIALIVFVVIAVFGLAWGYLMFKSSSDAHTQLEELQTRLRGEEDAKRNLQQENESYRTYMGMGENDSYDTVNETYTEDMGRFGQTFDESRRNYRDILEYIHEENLKIAQREAEAKEDVRKLNERLAALEEEKEAQINEYEAQAKAAEADAAAQRNEFAADRAQLEATKQELLTSRAQQKEYYESELAKRQAEVDDLAKRLGGAVQAQQKLLEERATAAESFEVPDGRISWVNQDGTVWINLGAADALRRQITFSVYDAALHDPAKAEKKGSIEVTRILGDHMAEARVTSDEATNPILSGDYVYSQVWHPGKKLRFAFTGLIDINSDGESDLRQAIDLVELNGGVVDAYVDDEGNQQGEIDVDTRYLVLGELPEDAIKAYYRDSWSAMTADANDQGVEPILLAEFLNQMGYQAEERTVALGAGARSSDFAAGTDTDRGSRNPAAKFRRRTPYRTPNSTPY